MKRLARTYERLFGPMHLHDSSTWHPGNSQFSARPGADSQWLTRGVLKDGEAWDARENCLYIMNALLSPQGLWSRNILPICKLCPFAFDLQNYISYKSLQTAQAGPHFAKQGCPGTGSTLCACCQSPPWLPLLTWSWKLCMSSDMFATACLYSSPRRSRCLPMFLNWWWLGYKKLNGFEIRRIKRISISLQASKFHHPAVGCHKAEYVESQDLTQQWQRILGSLAKEPNTCLETLQHWAVAVIHG